MAEKRYSAEDQKKRTADRMENLRARGIDVRGIKPLIPGGIPAVLDHIEKNLSNVRDQSQKQVSEPKARKKR